MGKSFLKLGWLRQEDGDRRVVERLLVWRGWGPLHGGHMEEATGRHKFQDLLEWGWVESVGSVEQGQGDEATWC